MLLIRVQYNNGLYDCLPGRVLDLEIAHKNIMRFYRPSEKRWVTIGVDNIRGMGGVYDGPERRSHPATAIIGTS